MCDIGKPVEMLEVQPLSIPASLRKETEVPAEQPATVEVPVTVAEPVVVTTEKV